MTKAEHILTKLSQAAPPDPTAAPVAKPATPASGAAKVAPVPKVPKGAGTPQAPPAAKAATNTATTDDGYVNKRTTSTEEKPGYKKTTSKQEFKHEGFDEMKADVMQSLGGKKPGTMQGGASSAGSALKAKMQENNQSLKDGMQQRADSAKAGMQQRAKDMKSGMQQRAAAARERMKQNKANFGKTKMEFKGLDDPYFKEGSYNMNKEAKAGAVKAIAKLIGRAGTAIPKSALGTIAKGYQSGMGAIGRAALRQSALPVKGVTKGKRMVDTGFGKKIHTNPGAFGAPNWTAKDLALSVGGPVLGTYAAGKVIGNQRKARDDEYWKGAVQGMAQSQKEGQPHTISAGENLESIAKNYNTTVDDLMKMNPNLVSPDVIEAGKELAVPVPRFKDGIPLYKEGEHNMRTDKEKIIANAFINEIREQGGLQKVAWTWGGVWDGIKDIGGKVHDYAVGPALDVVGMIPAVGNVADLANAGIYGLRGQPGNAALSAAAAIPGVGIGATAAKWGSKGVKAVKGAKQTKATVPTIIKQTKKLKEAYPAPGKTMSKITPFKNPKLDLVGRKQVLGNWGADQAKKIVNKFPNASKYMQRLSTAPGGGLGTGPLNSKLLRYGVGTAKAWKGIERPLTTYAFGPDKTPFQSAWKGIKDVGHMGANAAGYYSGDQLSKSLLETPDKFGLPKHIGNPGAWSADGSTFDNTWRPGAVSDTTSTVKSKVGNTGKKKGRAIDNIRANQ